MQIQKLLLVSVIFLTHICTYGQSLYHIKYNFDPARDTTIYNGFLVFFEDGSGLLRLRYLHNGADMVIEADAQEKPLEPGVMADSNNTTFIFVNPRVSVGKGTDVIPLPEIEFSLNKTTAFAEPSAAIQPAGTAIEKQIAPNFSATHIPVAALQKKFLLQFFSEDEDFYKSIFQNVTRGLSTAEKNTRIHLLIVANTKEKIIGGSCALDKERTLQTFTELSKYLGIRLLVDSVAGTNYSKKSAEDAIKKLKPAPNDVVVFYYSGHGYRKPGGKSRFPFIDLRAKPSEDHVKQSMGMEEIFAMIKKKGARTNLVLSDCCNNDVRESNIVGSKPLKTKSSGIQWSEENLRQLFFNKTPISILATSADEGQKASGNEKFGGFFSYFFKTSMENYCSKLKSNPTWDVVFQNTKAQTIHKASRTYCQKPYTAANICKQSPYYEIQSGR